MNEKHENILMNGRFSFRKKEFDPKIFSYLRNTAFGKNWKITCEKQNCIRFKQFAKTINKLSGMVKG